MYYHTAIAGGNYKIIIINAHWVTAAGSLVVRPLKAIILVLFAKKKITTSTEQSHLCWIKHERY